MRNETFTMVSGMKIPFEDFKIIVAQNSYLFTGAGPERAFGSHLSIHFPNSEYYWKHFIVPGTNRIATAERNGRDLAGVRDGVSQDIRDIGSFHYSIFLNLVYAGQFLTSNPEMVFEYFYIHLAITCDLVEEFLQRVHFLVLECMEKKCRVSTMLTKEEFLTYAGEWYDEKYEQLFEHYFSKGKKCSINIPSIHHILKEYFGTFAPWKKFKTLALQIRTYRNAIVHHHKLALPLDASGFRYIPRHDKLNQYKKWSEVERAMEYPNLVETDFIRGDKLMRSHLVDFQTTLNQLWQKPIADMTVLPYENKNPILLQKLCLEFV